MEKQKRAVLLLAKRLECAGLPALLETDGLLLRKRQQPSGLPALSREKHAQVRVKNAAELHTLHTIRDTLPIPLFLRVSRWRLEFTLRISLGII